MKHLPGDAGEDACRTRGVHLDQAGLISFGLRARGVDNTNVHSCRGESLSTFSNVYRKEKLLSEA
jgi:hypothetical protein